MRKVVKGALIGGAVGGAVAGVQAARATKSPGTEVGGSTAPPSPSVRDRVLRAAAEGALVGAGVGFVLDRRDARRAAALRSRSGVRAGAVAVADAALPVLQHAAEAARSRAEQAAEAARPRVATAAETVRSRAEQAAEAARPRVATAAETVRSRAEQAAEAARPRVATAAETVRSRAADAAETVRSRAAEAVRAGAEPTPVVDASSSTLKVLADQDAAPVIVAV
jgi:hypothetical protein